MVVTRVGEEEKQRLANGSRGSVLQDEKVLETCCIRIFIQLTLLNCMHKNG